MQIFNVKKFSIAAIALVFVFLVTGFLELADARSRGGGRSFGRSKSPTVSKPAATRSAESATQSSRPGNTGGAFTRGLAGGVAGGLMGGFIGNMLFGGTAHGMGTGGLGGSGIGLFEILLMAGLAYFLYKKFFKRKLSAATAGGGVGYARNTPGLFGGQNATNNDETGIEAEDPLVAGVQQIWQVDENFHPDRFKETAQDLFFDIQAGWTRRDGSALMSLVGNQLLAEYELHFAKMAEKGQLNRLENIAVRNVDLVQAGVEEGEIFVTVRFTANLLDYTIDEKSGKIVAGDRENPVKFDENWTFARPVESTTWKLEGIEVL